MIYRWILNLACLVALIVTMGLFGYTRQEIVERWGGDK